jgi:hypothetical protein
VTVAQDRQLERTAVAEERTLFCDALTRGMGALPFAAVKTEFERRVDAASFVEVSQAARRPSPRLHYARGDRARAGHDPGDASRSAPHPGAGEPHDTRPVRANHAHLSESQRAAIDQILTSHDQVLALDGVAGAGMTTTLSAVCEASERHGYQFEGFAPPHARRSNSKRPASRPARRNGISHALTNHGDGRHLYVPSTSAPIPTWTTARPSRAITAGTDGRPGPAHIDMERGSRHGAWIATSRIGPRSNPPYGRNRVRPASCGYRRGRPPARAIPSTLRCRTSRPHTPCRTLGQRCPRSTKW